MAYSVSVNEKFNEGPHRVHVLSIVADAAAESVDTGLDYVRFFTVGIKSAASAPIKIFHNQGVAGTSIAGNIGITGAASGDELFVVCYGR